MARSVNGHHAPSARDAPRDTPRARVGRTAIARRGPGSARRPGQTQPMATRSPGRSGSPSAGSTSSVVLQPNARSENVTSTIAVTSAATLNIPRPSATSTAAAIWRSASPPARGACDVEQPRDIGRRVRELRGNAGGPGAGIDRRQADLARGAGPARAAEAAAASARAARAARRRAARAAARRSRVAIRRTRTRRAPPRHR